MKKVISKVKNTVVKSTMAVSESTGIYVRTGLWKEIVASAVLSSLIVGVAVANGAPYVTGALV